MHNQIMNLSFTWIQDSESRLEVPTETIRFACRKGFDFPGKEVFSSPPPCLVKKMVVSDWDSHQLLYTDAGQELGPAAASPQGSWAPMDRPERRPFRCVQRIEPPPPAEGSAILSTLPISRGVRFFRLFMASVARIAPPRTVSCSTVYCVVGAVGKLPCTLEQPSLLVVSYERAL